MTKFLSRIVWGLLAIAIASDNVTSGEIAEYPLERIHGATWSDDWRDAAADFDPGPLPERGLRSWEPPVGIPHPGFGIEDSPPGSPASWTGPVAGFYYVDNTHPASTDSNNPYGYPSRPRKTIPYDPPLPAGSVVEVHGGPYNYGSGDFIRILADGTADNPVFVLGMGMPRFDKKVSVFSHTFTSSYLVIDGLDMPRCEIVAPAHHVAVRFCNVDGTAIQGGVAVASYTAPLTLNDIVIFANSIHDNGDWEADFDQDVHGVTVTARASNVWILDNQFYHNSGDGVQINASSDALRSTTHHIYVGRNTAWENKQTGFWTKQAEDVIFSENTVFAHYPVGESPSAWGAGMGYQYGPERVWFINNHIFDCAYGIQAMSPSGTSGQDSYFVGNVIHSIHHHPGYTYNPASAWSNAALMLVGTPNRWIINNTLFDVDAGINGPANGMYYMANNIIEQVTELEGNHVFIEGGGSAMSRLENSLLSEEARIRWGSTAVYDLAGFQEAFSQRTTGCRSGAPGFIDPDGQDFHVDTESVVIDHGVTSSVYARFRELYGIDICRDRDGASRPMGRWMDIGAYEQGRPHVYTDLDNDGDVDLGDWTIFSTCMAGPNLNLPAGCNIADFDADDDVDLADFAEIQLDCRIGSSGGGGAGVG